jgi:cytochrome d ubiquinol oxidase subunit II
MDYAIAWGVLISIALFIYMALDGFDIGIGILFPFSSSTQERDYMMQSIAPIWDANETWIVLAGGGLYATFPKAYVFIFNALYIPLIAMLIFLIFRGVSFEFRFKSPQKFKFIWSCMFFLGSLGIAVCQGIILGQLIQGFHTINGGFDNNYWAWYQKFNFLTGGLISLFYGFMGANFLIYRLNGAGKARFIRISKWLLGIALVYLVALIANRLYVIDQSATAAIFPSSSHLIERFYTYYSIYMGILFCVLLTIIKLYYSLSNTKSFDGLPFIYGIVLFALIFGGIAFLGWPYIVPGVYTVWEASSLPETQKLMFTGAAIFLPLILGYSLYNFYIFRGKIAAQKFYH